MAAVIQMLFVKILEEASEHAHASRDTLEMD